MSVSRLIYAALGCAFMVLPHTVNAQDKPNYQLGMLPPGHIMLPDGDVQANIFLMSDAGGWGDEEEKQAKALVEKGAAVVGIDFPTYMKALSADEGDCVYMISDIEELAHEIQREAKAQTYRLPILAGVGEGGALALAMIAQSPASTIGEAIAVDPLAGIPLENRILCTPATKEKAGNRTIYGLTDGDLPAPVTVLFSTAAKQEGRDHATALQTKHPDIDIQDVTGQANDELLQALSDRVDAAGATDQPLGLPLTILDAKPSMDTMAVIYSGDGGWRDIDKEMGGYLQKQGIPVVGVDSLRYFWSERKPQEATDDLARIIETYRHQWGVHHVLLVGYSFGADILPALYDLLPEKDKERVALMSLMALSHQADYKVSVEGWLGIQGEGSAGDPVDYIKKMDASMVQCIYGKDDDENACPALEGSGANVVALEGGHHFDGDYEALAQRVLTLLKTRLGK
jgi:type IV secretory pathway VirJ component